MSADLEDYTKLVADRPVKFSDEEVDYRESDGKEKCGKCLHFYTRQLDGFGVCEIFRSDETDKEGVMPDMVCSFFTRDGEVFPLLKEGESHDHDDSDDS